MEESNNNKRIAKNTLMLYIRMFFVIGLNLYTSRLILASLGASDFGVYGIVGGVVTMMSFLNNSLAGATQRFLTFELGKKNFDKLKQIFNASFFNHVLIAVAVVVLGETIGLWFLNHKLNIPENRMFAANIVYQVSIFTACANFLKVPFIGAIIAHERMGIFSITSIAEVLIKTGLILLLSYVLGDTLIVYSIFLLGLAIFMLVWICLACRKIFEECRGISLRQYKFAEAKPMLMFSGWDLFGNFSFTLRNQGLNMLVNIFFGVIINASVSISNSVNSAIGGFAGSFNTALNPRIVKLYASQEYGQLFFLINKATIYSTLLLSFVCLSLIVNVDLILGLWLKEVPEYTNIFVSISVVGVIFGNLFAPLIMLIQAIGDVKKMSLYTGIVLLITVPINYVIFLYFPNPSLAFIVNSCSQFVRGIVLIVLLKRLMPSFIVKTFLFQTVAKTMSIVLVSYLICLNLRPLLNGLSDFVSLFTSMIIIAFAMFILLVLTDDFSKKYFLNIIKKCIDFYAED